VKVRITYTNHVIADVPDELIKQGEEGMWGNNEFDDMFESLKQYVPPGSEIKGWDTYDSITDTPEFQEYLNLAEGWRISGEWKGLKYEADICWEEDRYFDLQIEHVETLPDSDMRFWLGEILTSFNSDLLMDIIRESPEAKDFQRRIDEWCDTVPDDLSDMIIEAYYETLEN